MRIFLSIVLLALAGCAGNPYVDAGLTAEDVTVYEFRLDTREAVALERNPLGRIAVGYEVVPTPSWRVSLDVAHTSSLSTGKDRGVNSANLNVRWYPFHD